MSSKVNSLLVGLNPEFEKLIPFVTDKIQSLNKVAVGKSEKLFSEKDTMLITYADQFSSQDKNNIQTLNDFIEQELQGCTNIIHILPFYPWTSDDGFSPTDYQQVRPEYGEWRDIETIPSKKMFDCVFNHISTESELFKKALAGDVETQSMFHIVSEEEYKSDEFQSDIKKIVRPRTSPLFTPYNFNGETKYVWTTFSSDQVDTNLNSLPMMKYLLETFFLYIEKGAQYFRIDAVPFMWKDWGTNCSHRPKTHRFVQLLRSICDAIDTDLYIVTESNVPHQENISYWGNGGNEAHIIYNFSLAPLILHALTFQTNEYISDWAKQVFDISPATTYLNFTASHDGIGMRGLEGIVPEEDVATLCRLTEDKGGVVGKKRSRDGTERPYELNITWAQFLYEQEESDELFIKKVVNSHAIVMFFPGIGAHYLHNFLGTKNWTDGMEDSGIPRRLNRKKLEYPLNLSHLSKRILEGLIHLVNYKCSQEVFSPSAKIEMIETSEPCIAFRRFTNSDSVDVYFNLSSDNISVNGIELSSYELAFR